MCPRSPRLKAAGIELRHGGKSERIRDVRGLLGHCDIAVRANEEVHRAVVRERRSVCDINYDVAPFKTSASPSRVTALMPLSGEAATAS